MPDTPNDRTRVSPGALDSDTDPSATYAQTAVPEVPGTVSVPGYEVLGEVARGGMGVVYRARDPRFERAVAIKVMHHGQDAERFVVEAKVTAQLPHPGIPPVHELGRLADGRPFLAMKLIEGRTLGDEMMGATRADLPQLLAAFERICETVGFAHARGIVHRDLKPANVMVGAFGEVLVMDWGLAKDARVPEPAARTESALALPAGGTGNSVSALRGSNSQATLAGTVKGTPAYMAPEQARGEPVDARADVFALGGILAAVLTGRAPFAGNSALDTIIRAGQGDVEEIFDELDRCKADRALVAVAKKCLAARAADRYADGTAVGAAVVQYRANVEERLRRAERDRAAAEAAAEEEANTRREAEARLAEQRKRRRAQALLGGTVTLLLLAGGAFAWYADRERERERRTKAEYEAELARDAADRRAVEAVAAERDRVAREQAERGVKSALALAEQLRAEERFRDAAEVVAQARGLAGDAPQLRAEVDRAEAALRFVADLDDVRYELAFGIRDIARGSGRYEAAEVSAAYEAAFRARGYDPDAGAPALAERLRASGAAREVADALDLWACFEPNATRRDAFLAAVRAAAPDPWLDRLRTPAVRDDPTAFAALVREAEDNPPRPSAVAIVQQVAKRHKQTPTKLFVVSLTRSPANFQLLYTFGLLLGDVNAGQAVAYLQAARALRPDSPLVAHVLAVALDKWNTSGAEWMMLELHRSAPNARNAQSYISVWGLRKNRLDLARAAGERAVAADPNSATAHYALATALVKVDPNAAVRSAREARRLSSTWGMGHAPLAFCALGGADLEPGEGLRAAREYARLEADSAVAHYLVGQLARRDDELDEARAAYARAAELDPASYGKYTAIKLRAHAPPPRESPRAAGQGPFLDALHRGRELLESDPKAAAEALREAVRLDPTDSEARAVLAVAVALTGRSSDGLPEALAALRLGPDRARAHYALLVVRLGLGEYRAAVAAGREAVRLDPEDAGFWYGLGIALLKLNDTVGARTAYERAALFDSKKYGKLHATLPAVAVAPAPRAGIDRTDPAALVARGTELRNAGKTAEAADLYRAALKFEPTNSRTHNLLGLCFHAEKNYAAAAVHYRDSIRHDPVYAVAHSNLSVALRLSGHAAEAEAMAKVALRLSPRYAHAHAALGFALRARGDEATATRVLAEAARLDPKQYGQYAPKKP